MIAHRFRSVAALLGAVVAGAVTLTGCGAALGVTPAGGGSPQSSWTASPPPTNPSADPWTPFPASAGCWLPDSGMAPCGELVSVDGRPPGDQPPGGQVLDMRGVYRLSAPYVSSDGQVMLFADTDGPCVASAFSVPVRIDGNMLYPDASQMSGPAIGCAYATGPDYGWVSMSLFANPLRVAQTDNGTIRLGSADGDDGGYVDVAWG